MGVERCDFYSDEEYQQALYMEQVVKTLKVSVVWTPLSVKELLWKPIQNAVLAKTSTTELEKEIKGVMA